ncbi:MAG: YihY/virulence factor BrkB family protein [Bacteroidota bacterium]|nr:YihY/virulence factor BrkB family protein [Bacteroidota bacterium]
MFDKTQKYIVQSKPYVKAVAYLKNIHFTKEGVSLYSILKIFVHKVDKDDVFERANGVAFNFTLAIFPAIIFLFTLIPFLSNFTDVSKVDIRFEIMEFMEEVMPESMYDVAASTIVDIISKQRGGLLTFGFLFAFFMATNGMLSLMNAFNRCYKTSDKRGYIKTRLMASLLTVVLSFVLITAVIVLGIGQLFLNYIQGYLAGNYIIYLLLLLRYVILFLIFYVTISFIFHYAPAVTFRWRFFSVGSIMAALLCILVSFAFSYYISTFSTYNKLYGSIGALMGLMIWFYLISVALLLGFELNASIDKARIDFLQDRIVE